MGRALGQQELGVWGEWQGGRAHAPDQAVPRRCPSCFPTLRGPSTALTLCVKAILLRSSWFGCAWQTVLVLIPFRPIPLLQRSQGHRHPTPNSWGYGLKEQSSLPQGNYFGIPYWIISHTCKRHRSQVAGLGSPHLWQKVLVSPVISGLPDGLESSPLEIHSFVLYLSY